MTELELASSPCFADEAVLGFAPEPPRGLAVLVMAGGEGRRMGGGKALRLLAGRPLLLHAWEQARRYGLVAAIGLREQSQIGLRLGAERVLDAPGLAGPLASLAAGLAWAAGQGMGWLLTLPCDAPFLPDDLAVRLLAAAHEGAAAGAAPRSGGRLHPASALWSVRLLGQLPAYAAGGRSSLSGFAEACCLTPVDWQPGAEDPFFNVNTEVDLAAAEARFIQPHLA